MYTRLELQIDLLETDTRPQKQVRWRGSHTRLASQKRVRKGLQARADATFAELGTPQK